MNSIHERRLREIYERPRDQALGWSYRDLLRQRLGRIAQRDLENERVHRTIYATRARAIADITAYIELRYNHKRLHPALGHRTPDEVENEWYATRQAA